MLGVNTADDRKIALDYLKSNKAGYPTVLDNSWAAQTAIGKYESLAGYGAVPMTYLIDREGKVYDAWYGYEPGRAEKALKKLGM